MSLARRIASQKGINLLAARVIKSDAVAKDAVGRARRANALKVGRMLAASSSLAYVPSPSPRGRSFARAGLRPEPKTVDTSIGGMVFDNNSAVASTMKLLNTIPTGTSATSRVGKRVALKAIAIRGNIAAASATTMEKCTMLLVYIRTPNQATTLPAWTEILKGQTSYDLTNRDNASKFKILRRWDYEIIGNATTPSTGMEEQYFEYFVPLRGLPSTWTNASTAGTIGEFEEGALILCTVGDAANGATTTCTCSGNTRLYFTDM